jgi:hypothetical protein
MNMRKHELEEWCREFHLNPKGTVATLKQRLKEFSADRNAWNV